MTLDLGQAIPTQHEFFAARPLALSDEMPLAELMLAAYRGTVDDEGEDIVQARDEVRRTFEGAYGPLLWTASFVVEARGAPGGTPTLLSASVITFWQDAPLLAFSVTHPTAGRSGLATGLIRQSARTLAEQGHTRLDLVVTRGNIPAERLYAQLGFHEV